MLKTKRKILQCKKVGGSQHMKTGNICSYLTLIVILTDKSSPMVRKQELGMPTKIIFLGCLLQLMELLRAIKIQCLIIVLVEFNKLHSRMLIKDRK
jgi:hypothetical protein